MAPEVLPPVPMPVVPPVPGPVEPPVLTPIAPPVPGLFAPPVLVPAPPVPLGITVLGLELQALTIARIEAALIPGNG